MRTFSPTLCTCAVTLFIISLLAASVSAAHRHKCVHTEILRSSPPVYEISQPADLRRGMETLSLTWHSIRFLFNFTYVENPDIDIYHTSGSEVMHRVCTYAGENLKIGGSPLTSLNCTAPDGTVQYVNGCLLYCRPEDVVTPALTSKLKTIIATIVAGFSQMLSVPDTQSNDVTVESDPLTNDCIGHNIPRTTYNADIVIYVTMRPLRLLGSTLAFARTCGLDSRYARPILGHMNVAPDTLATNHELETVLRHELTHALGFSPSLFPYMRHPNNVSQTYHQYDAVKYPTGPVTGTGVVTSDNGTTFSIDYRLLAPDKRLKLISPNLVSFARQYFGCPVLDGVELENGGNSSASTASHWEKRILFFEYMVSDQNYEPGKVSGFTLSYLEDMGCYKANLAKADPMDWGAGMGCSWAEGDCSQWPENYFCTFIQTPGCGYNRRFSGRCNLQSYVSDMPLGYRHFPNNTKQGGEDIYADRCPIVVTYVANGMGGGPCENASNYPTSHNQFGVRTGYSSRCFLSSTTINTHTSSLASRCFQVFCNSSAVPHARIGNQFFPCRDDLIFELIAPPRAKSTANKQPSASTFFVNWEWSGLVQCGKGLGEMCSHGELLNTTVAEWASIDSISPSSAIVDGGTHITITGTGLNHCKHLRIGGLYAKNLTAHSSTNMTAITAEVTPSSEYGGSGSQGEGAVDVELFCNLTSLCPEGCVVGRLVGQFNYTIPESDLFSAMDLFTDFMGTPTGRVVGGGAGFVLIIIAFFVVRSCLADGDGGSSFGGESSEGQRRRRLPPKRGVARHAPQHNLSQFEEELL